MQHLETCLSTATLQLEPVFASRQHERCVHTMCWYSEQAKEQPREVPQSKHGGGAPTFLSYQVRIGVHSHMFAVPARSHEQLAFAALHKLAVSMPPLPSSYVTLLLASTMMSKA